MDPTDTSGDTQQLSADPFPFARSYQLEALEAAIKQNTIVFLETGAGKTLIATMLLKFYAHQLRKPSSFIAVFLVPAVVLVTQQSEYLMRHTDLKAGKYWGDLGVDYWDAATWKKQVDEYEVLVMTPQILLDALSHSFLKFETIKVLIFDECHHARGKHAYARIMREFYHENVNSHLPRIFGMTASLIKAKGSSSESSVWKVISDLENLMNSKVYTCASESVLSKYIPFSTPKVKYYNHRDVPNSVHEGVKKELEMLKQKHELSLSSSSLSNDTAKATKKKLDKLYYVFMFCLTELGIWLAFKAAESLSRVKNGIFLWERVDPRGEAVMRNFSLEASKVFKAWFPSGQCWRIGADIKADMEFGYLTAKVTCLLESLTEYRELKGLRCIIFVERIITAVVLQSLLNEFFSRTIGWKTAYTAGHAHVLQAQSRNEQNKIVEEFRKGQVNIIVSTSMLEEGLDVQSCNLVIRFDPSATVCSFIQSRGRARMQNSVFLILVESGDENTLDRVKRFMKSGEVMRQQSLSHVSDPCMPLIKHVEACYKVETTGAIVNMSSCVSLLHFYCSRLPSDGYFKPSPRFVIDTVSETCTLHLPKSCPIQTIVVNGGRFEILKQLACLEACKQLHMNGALTDNLVPDILEEEADAQQLSHTPYIEEQVQYVPSQLVGCNGSEPETRYYIYLIELTLNFDYNIQPHAIWLAVRSNLQLDEESSCFDLHADRGCVTVRIKHCGEVRLTSQQVELCQLFQNAVFRVLIDHDMNWLDGILASFQQSSGSYNYDYLLLPSNGSCQNPVIDWTCICSVCFSREEFNHLSYCQSRGNFNFLYTYNGFSLCRCALENCVVYTPHNKYLYCISGILNGLDGNSSLNLKDDQSITYKEYYKKRHGLNLLFDKQPLLRGKRIFTMQNFLQRCENRKVKESTNATVELPPELCYVIMSPVSVAAFYSFSYCPSILHRIESLLVAADLKRMNVYFSMQNDVIPTIKVLEAITTKRCQEKIHLESLETLGDSFLKYAVTRQLFMTYGKHHEGLLSIKREKIISNVSLCNLGCLRNIPGYLRNEPFDPKTWIVPGNYSTKNELDVVESNPCKSSLFIRKGRRKIRSKTVADCVEALIGAFLSSGGKGAALSFMKWLGIEVDLLCFPYTMPLSVDPSNLVNIEFFDSLLKYTFRDTSLLVEALTHGSYMLPEISRCYQRLEFLGDAVLDFLITELLYKMYPSSSPGLLTDLRSASVNNDFYARCAVKIGLHKHILHASQDLHHQIATTLDNFEQLSAVSSFGWESESIFPKVLGDVIESIAGAILVDSGYDPDIVFRSMGPLLGPLISPEMLKLHPVRELTEICQKEHFKLKKTVVKCENGKACVEVEVEANDGVIYKNSCSSSDKKTAKRLACKAVLKSLKEVKLLVSKKSRKD